MCYTRCISEPRFVHGKLAQLQTGNECKFISLKIGMKISRNDGKNGKYQNANAILRAQAREKRCENILRPPLQGNWHVRDVLKLAAAASPCLGENSAILPVSAQVIEHSSLSSNDFSVFYLYSMAAFVQRHIPCYLSIFTNLF